MLDSITQIARDAVTSAGYLGVFAAMVAENIFPPIPSEIVLPLAGYEASRGELTAVAVILAATLGSLVGALVLYALGRYGGRPLILRLGWLLRVDERGLDRAERWFARRGDVVVLGARVVPLARSVVSIPAGMMRMGLTRFCLLTAAGSLAWNALLVGAGYQLGANWDDVTDLVGVASKVALGLALVAAAASVTWLRRRSARVG